MEQSTLGKLELRVRELQQELEHLSQDKLALHSDISMVQQQLQGKGRTADSCLRAHSLPLREVSDAKWGMGFLSKFRL